MYELDDGVVECGGGRSPACDGKVAVKLYVIGCMCAECVSYSVVTVFSQFEEGGCGEWGDSVVHGSFCDSGPKGELVCIFIVRVLRGGGAGKEAQRPVEGCSRS